MSNTKKEIIKQEIKQIESSLMNHWFKISENRNTFFYDMLNDFSISICFPIISDLLQYLQLFFYIFKENVSYFIIIFT